MTADDLTLAAKLTEMCGAYLDLIAEEGLPPGLEIAIFATYPGEDGRHIIGSSTSMPRERLMALLREMADRGPSLIVGKPGGPEA